MTVGSFVNSLDETCAFLKRIKLLKMVGIKSIYKDGVSEDFKTVSQKASYFDSYKTGKLNYDFDFLLRDESFLQFSFTENEGLPDIRFAFFQNPQEFRTYEDYLDFLKDQGLIAQDEVEEAGDLFIDEYEQFMVEQQVNSKSLGIRYDVDFSNYRPLIHAVSHLHIGHQNNLRIPVKRILTPLKFTLFVLKHVYYYEWEAFVTKSDPDFIKAFANEKVKCKSLRSPAQWRNEEEYDLYLT